jgi:hypothetical protein
MGRRRRRRRRRRRKRTRRKRPVRKKNSSSNLPASIFLHLKKRPVKRHYYYLVAGLQDITLDIHKLILDQEAFRETLKTELHKNDYKLVEKLFLPFDNANLLNLLQKNDKPFNEKGNFSRELLEENIKEPDSLPAYMNRFIVAFKNKEPIFTEKSPENELTTLFYDDVLQDRERFSAQLVFVRPHRKECPDCSDRKKV